MIHWLGSDLATTLAQDNTASFRNYTELGWEVSVGRLKVIRMIAEGKITRDDTILTLKDRMFFYSKFCNVEPFVRPPDKFGLSPENLGEWSRQIHVENGKHVAWRWPQDIPTILNFDFEPCEPPRCVMITHRIRGWCPNRNADENNTRAFVSMVMDLGYKPYIGGLHAEGVDPRAEYVPTLRRLASIIHHPNCVAIIASGGPTLLAQQCCRSKLVCLKTCGDDNPWFEHPLYLSRHLNFAGCKVHLVSPNDVAGTKKILMEG